MYRNDWIMRQINDMVEVLARLIFHRPAAAYEIQDQNHLTKVDELHLQLVKLLGQMEIGKAEDLLFAGLDDKDESTLWVALDFYDRLNHLGDDELEEHGFSREEIGEGLAAVKRIFDITL